MIYVHLDTTNNAVLTLGINEKDIYQHILHKPKNILLLNPNSEYGNFENHTALKILRGSEAVADYFDTKKKTSHEELRWIDFSDVTMLKELSALEISELLYLGHMKTHLHSPFFYKLQNNFAYFELKNTFARTYFRHLDEFYRILAGVITKTTDTQVNQNRGFCKKKYDITSLKIIFVKPLYEVMKEGIVIYENLATLTDNTFKLPIFLVEDGGFRNIKPNFSKDALLGYFIYNLNAQSWTIELNEDFNTFL